MALPQNEQGVFETREHSRFKGASWYPHKHEIVIGGAGGIGSWLSLFLARQGHDLFVYDFDKVERHNIGGQLYGETDIGKFKVNALDRLITDLALVNMSLFDQKYEEGSIRSNIMCACFDNMEARKVMFDGWVEFMRNDQSSDRVGLFIDGRLNAETAEVFCVTPEEKAIERWRSEWFSDDKVQDAPCSFKATSHCAAILAGMMTSCLNNFTANIYEGEERVVPYKTSIWLPTMMVQTEEL